MKKTASKHIIVKPLKTRLKKYILKMLEKKKYCYVQRTTNTYET